VNEDRILEDPVIREKLKHIPVGVRLAYAQLIEERGWKELKAHFEGFESRAADLLARSILRGEKVSAEQIAHQRGYIAAIKDIFDYPERVEKDLERAVLRAWDTLQETEATQEVDNE